MQGHLAGFTERSADLVALSVDGVEDSKALAAKEHLEFAIVSDPQREVIKAFGLDDPANEIAWPAVYVLRPDGTVAWRAFLESYKTRPPVSEVLAAVEQAKAP